MKVARLRTIFSACRLGILFIGCVLFTSSPVLAQTVDYDTLCSDLSGCAWYAPNETCGSTSNTGRSNDTPGSQTGVWESGLQPPYILEQFAIETLKAVAQKRSVDASSAVTEEHVIALVAFMYGEGGDIMNQDLFNPLNTGLNAPELLDGPSRTDGVQSFKSFDAGVEATARTIVGSFQSRLADVLTLKDSTADQFMEALTYFSKYAGNKFWAAASLPPNDASYYQQRLQLVSQIRSNYADMASYVVGTPAFEQSAGIRDKSKLTYNPVGSGSTVPAGSSSSKLGCSAGTSGVQAGNMVKTALGLAWPNKGGHATPGGETGSAQSTPAYQSAMPQYNGSTGTAEYTDCGVFTSTVVIASGADKDYPKRGTDAQLNYARSHPEKWQVREVSTTKDLLPGDVLITSYGLGHTYIYTGEYKGSDGVTYNSASASLFDHPPEAANFYQDYGGQHFVAVRLIAGSSATNNNGGTQL